MSFSGSTRSGWTALEFFTETSAQYNSPCRTFNNENYETKCPCLMFSSCRNIFATVFSLHQLSESLINLSPLLKIFIIMPHHTTDTASGIFLTFKTFHHLEYMPFRIESLLNFHLCHRFEGWNYTTKTFTLSHISWKASQSTA